VESGCFLVAFWLVSGGFWKVLHVHIGPDAGEAEVQNKRNERAPAALPFGRSYGRETALDNRYFDE
jgi:hypothetical protein